jgi:hypothetical protein
VQPKARILRRLVALILAGFGVVVVIGSVFLAEGDRPAGVFLIIIGVVFAGFYLALVLVWDLFRNGSTSGEATGRIVSRLPLGGARLSVGHETWTWTGGGSLVGRFGRVNATVPLVVLELSAVALTLRIRPKAIGRMFGAGSLTWTASDLIGIYPARGRWVSGHSGLAIESPSGVCYFWTFEREYILGALELQHFPVSWGERFISFSLV